MPTPRPTAKPKDDVPDLRTLGPQYDSNLHARHASVLLKVLSDTSSNAPRNIALAGHYGSGKSSVILGVQQGLDARSIKWVNLSLSSLGTDNSKRSRMQEDGTLAPLTNLIQKEIVKQLLYRKAPKDMPGSRYFRIDSFRSARAIQWALASAFGVFTIAVLSGLVNRVEKVAPRWAVDGPTWTPWAAVGLLGAFVGVVCFLALRGLQNPIKVDSVSAGGAAVSLSAKENSYFDEYLDEIVYFFQQTKTRVAIFEDLDRFKDPHIFETLRELNTVLNHSEQVKSRPVKFVYAVRDSIFEQLEVASADVAPNEDAPEAEPSARPMRASVQESIPSANRTKFFDLVVPMVPFLTHRSARDLLAEEFKTSPNKPSTAVINLIGGHRALTDMRLIRNIRNEFEIYRASVLSDQGLQGLTADRLFAMMVYKNTHLEDFEAIRHGTSEIDMAHRAFRQMVEHQSTSQASRSRVALYRVRSAISWEARGKAVGRSLQKTLPLLHRGNRIRSSTEPQVITGFGIYELSALTSADFWQNFRKDDGTIDIGHPGYTTLTLSHDEFLIMGGDAGIEMERLVEIDTSELQRQSREALDIREFVSTATMAELMARTDLTMPVDGGEKERNLNEIVSDIVSPLARDLLAQGLLDENFTLYCSDYQGVAISVSAMNFILHCVQVDQADALFRFDAPASIEAVENEVGERFLGGESVFNVDVFDHYLAGNIDRLNSAFDRLVVRAASHDTAFIDLYFADQREDKVAAKRRLVAELTPRWPGALAHLVESTSNEQRAGLVDVALRNASSEVRYRTSDALAEFIEVSYSELGVFTDGLADPEAVALADLLSKLEIEIPALAHLGPSQRRAITAADQYPVNRANLWAALDLETDDGDQSHDEALALDSIKARNEVVYRHVLRHLDEYLSALATRELTIKKPSDFLGVLNDLDGTPDELVHTLTKRAATGCVVSDLMKVSGDVWLPVVAADRFVTSVSNVSRYVREHGMTPAMAQRLVDHDLVAAKDVDNAERIVLAGELVEYDELTENDRIRLLGQLELTDYLELSELSASALEMIPALLGAGEVADIARTYEFIADRPYPFRERFFASSTDLPSYITSLTLSAEDLDELMRSDRVAPEVKAAITNDADFVAAHISRRAAITICNWALMGNDLTPALLEVLSEAKAPAEKIIILLEPHLPTIELSILDGILLGLGSEYEPLTRVGHHRPRLKPRPGTEKLLDELKKRSRVSSYSYAKIVGTIKVNMRH